MGIAFFATYLWAAHRRLFGGWIAERHVGYLIRRNIAGLFVYVIAIGVAFVNAPTSASPCAGSSPSTTSSPPPRDARGASSPAAI